MQNVQNSDGNVEVSGATIFGIFISMNATVA
jgi:hypothetical protein